MDCNYRIRSCTVKYFHNAPKVLHSSFSCTHSHTHPYTNGWQPPPRRCPAISGATWGSKSCSRTLQHVDSWHCSGLKARGRRVAQPTAVFASRRAADPSSPGCGRAVPGRLVRVGSLRLPWRPWHNSLPVVECSARCIIQACGQRRQVLLEREGSHSTELAEPTNKTKQNLPVA